MRVSFEKLNHLKLVFWYDIEYDLVFVERKLKMVDDISYNFL